jgi:hypothetical protein
MLQPGTLFAKAELLPGDWGKSITLLGGDMVTRRFITTGFVGLVLATSGCNDTSKGRSAGCGSSGASCSQIQTEADELRELREQAIRDNDYNQALQYTVDYNRRLELLQEYRNPGRDDRTASVINAEYNRIDAILAQDLENLRDEVQSSARQDEINQCTEPDQETTETCVKLRDLQSQIKQLEDLHAQETLTSEDKAPADAATETELKYSYLQLIDQAAGSLEATQQRQADYEKLWEILQQINFVKKPNGALPGMTCPPEHENRCRELEEDLVNLRAHRKTLLENPDPNSVESARQIDLEVNYKQELLDLLKSDETVSAEQIKELEERHDKLVQTLREQQNLRPYSESEHKAVVQVFNDFGELYINVSKKDATGRNIAEELKAQTGMPWSGYWYPKRKDDLFGKPESPLAKLDRASQVINRDAMLNSAAWEFSRFSPEDADWAGLCDAWALASIQSPEPKQPLKFANIVFTVSDLKALLIKKHEGYKARIYGNRYYGSHTTDGEIQDLRPEAFHQIVLKILGEKKQAIVIDEDPGPEVWSRPLYRFKWEVEQDKTRKNAFTVRAWPYLVKNRVSVDEALTAPADLKAPVYEYRLYIDPNNQKDGKFKVIYGEWINSSLSEHPDIVFLPQENPATGISPINPEIAKGLELIDRIFKEGTP